jgi:hypothetical protein
MLAMAEGRGFSGGFDGEEESMAFWGLGGGGCGGTE